MYYDYLDTPIGSLLLVGTKEALLRVAFEQDGRPVEPPDDAEHAPGELEVAKAQLSEYFAGERVTFDLTLEPQGTDFQRAVWDALATIPFGETWSYAELAERIGRPSAVRAVGAANGRNPLPVVLPCHAALEPTVYY